MAEGQIIPLSGLARIGAALRGRLYSSPPNTIAGVDPANWPSALQPVQPVGPPNSQPLRFSFWQGVNQNIAPRPDAPLNFTSLRNLSTYPLARMAIENVKDQVLSYDWSIKLKPLPGETKKQNSDRSRADKNIAYLTDFWRYPDGETPWADWGRPLLEDMLVIDAPTILLQRTVDQKKVVKCRVLDGSNILRLIDDQGYTPTAPSPAYTQLWDGVPRLLLTTDQLVYRPSNLAPRNTLASQLYGFSVTEQLAEEITIGMERLKFILAFYTQGSVPGLVHVVPNDVPPDAINDTMQAMNSELAGNLARRRQWRLIPGFHDRASDKHDQILQLPEPVLADVFDDYLIRKIAFGYGISAQRLQKTLNRAAAEAGQSASEKEGLLPRVMWLKRTIDLIIQRKQGFPGYEIVFDTDNELDPTKQAEVDKIYVSAGIETINEVREDRGRDPRPEKEADQLMVISANGPTPLEGATDRTEAESKARTQPKPAPASPFNAN